jgi:hypothetical protein
MGEPNDGCYEEIKKKQKVNVVFLSQKMYNFPACASSKCIYLYLFDFLTGFFVGGGSHAVTLAPSKDD